MTPKDTSREDILILLSSMGVVLPENTKLSVEDLNKRLGQAFDASQQIASLLDATPVNPNIFPKWFSRKTLHEATQRRNFTEFHNDLTKQPKQGDQSSKKDIFNEMRNGILCIASMYDKGAREFCYVDEIHKMGIFLRILDVRKIKDDIPFFLFEYRDVAAKSKDTLEKAFGNYTEGDDPITIHICDLERRALLKLFRRNAKKLDQNKEGEAIMDALYKSFVLPLCPLNMLTLGKLTLNAGCEVCGKKDTRKCVQCLAVAYCSRDCQKQDWPTHKVTCRSLKGGTWNTIKLDDLPHDVKHRTMINRLDTLSAPSRTGTYSKNSKNEGPPKDVHNGKIFLAKFQLSLGGSLHMMIYDRQRSFQLLWMRNSDTRLFDQAAAIMADRFKFYRWVRRVGDFEMDVCLDRAPQTDPVW